MFVHPVRMRPVRGCPVRGYPVIRRELAHANETELIFGEEAVDAQDVANPVAAGMRRSGFDDIVERQSARGLRVDGVAQVDVCSESHHPVIVDQGFDARVGEHQAKEVANEYGF